SSCAVCSPWVAAPGPPSRRAWARLCPCPWAHPCRPWGLWRTCPASHPWRPCRARPCRAFAPWQACRPRRRRPCRVSAAFAAFRLRPWLALLRNHLARALRDARLSAVGEQLEADARRLAVLGILQRQVRQMDRRLLGDDPALLRRRLFLMAPHQVDAAHQG